MGEDDFRALWFNASGKEGYTSVSEGRTILISLGEPRFINQICQIGLKWTLCGERCTTPFYQRLSRDFRYQAPPLFSRTLKRSGRLGTRLIFSNVSCYGLQYNAVCFPTQLVTIFRLGLNFVIIFQSRTIWWGIEFVEVYTSQPKLFSYTSTILIMLKNKCNILW